MEGIGIELVHLGHLIFTGTPAEETEPSKQTPYGQVDVTYCGDCRVAPDNAA